ncbi:hypothetical protein Mapa_011287 [Marchantia paleacea]|nr:hypothetical protein Mapa_011287 [Marchantia paleacea]
MEGKLDLRMPDITKAPRLRTYYCLFVRLVIGKPHIDQLLHISSSLPAETEDPWELEV